MKRRSVLLEGSDPKELQSRLVFGLAVGLVAGLIGLGTGLGAGAHRQAGALEQAFARPSAVCVAAEAEAGAKIALGEERNGGQPAARRPARQPVPEDRARPAAEPRVAAAERPQSLQSPQSPQRPPTYIRLREPEAEPFDPVEGLRPAL